MRRFRTMWIDVAGALFSVIVFRVVGYPDSLFACLSVALAVEVITGMLNMCDRLLDPPPAVFLIFSQQEKNLSRWLDIS